MKDFSQEEYQHYSRHFNLPDFGFGEQLKLKQSRVLVVGSGGLGSPLLLYLAAAGVGHIGIIDGDTVDRSNLQRQVLFTENDIGKSKVEKAKEQLEALNSNISIQTYKSFLTTVNALEIIKDYDIVTDGSDNFPTRYLVNDACVILGKPNVYASIYQYEGQVAVFNYTYEDGTLGPNYRDLFPEPPAPGLVPDCATGGVLGVLAGIVGSMQALEAIKLITGVGKPLAAKLLLYNAATAESRIIQLQKKTAVEIRELINYEDFCGVSGANNNIQTNMKEITVAELKQWRDDGKDFQLIDVRESNEVEFVNIGGDHIPLGDLMANQNDIADDKDVVFLCRTGQRSGAAVQAMTHQGFDNLINLKGGIVAWATEIDTSLPTY